MSEYLVVIEHEGESCRAYCPDLPGVGVVGATREEWKSSSATQSLFTSRACAQPARRFLSRLP
jgi:hypothetical protein